MSNEPAHSAHIGDYWPPDFGWSNGGANDPEQHSDQLVPLTFDGVSFGDCHKDAHALFTALLGELVPHIEGGLRAGSCGCYNPRSIAASGTRSFHSWGIAIDVNWDVNPMGTYLSNPNAGKPGSIPHAICSQIAKKYGCEYGGDWDGGDGHSGFKDYMHIEIHLSPTDARKVTPTQTDPLEEIMSWYKNQADFEAAMAKIAKDAVDSRIQEGFAKDYDGTPTTLYHQMQRIGPDGYEDPAKPKRAGDHK